ncbi:putative chromosome condensation protein [Myriangium duriaei CBS 260.36]|uniref:Chromosome condensation protein n=1 Tax=Myriangium duriaei CBS 260.36 TaxID=1168546 RepID=A0A9P4IU54_9PEZI|nr:putative chromosome condensation protein [Myriangium duriaei CBS 260.36]
MSSHTWFEDDQTELDSLDEVRAPPPVQNRDQNESRRHDPYLEDNVRREPQYHDRPSYNRYSLNRHQRSPSIGLPTAAQTLDEVIAPAPTHRSHAASYVNLEDTEEAKSSTRRFSSRLDIAAVSHLVTVSYLVFFSILGTLARLGVQWLTFYPGAPVTTSVLWANVGGSFFMGFLSEDRRLFQAPSFSQNNQPKSGISGSELKAHHLKVKKTIPLYVGLATGFCGSFTSFSSFMRDAFLALSNDLPSPYSHPFPAGQALPGFSSHYSRHNGYSVLAVLAVLIYEPALSIAALFVGAHAALLLDRLTPSIPYTFARHILDPLILVLGFGCWIGAVLISIFPPNFAWRGEVLFALVFAPLGCLLRFYASLKLNPLIASFPLGTFAVNIFGSTVLAVAYDLQRVTLHSVAGGSIAGCQVLQGIEDGFCGCLTTVSTWVAEIQGLRRRHAYIYALASLGAGLAVMIIIMGSVRWTVGWASPVCTTMRTTS